MPTPRELLEERLRRIEDEKQEFERDMKELERLVSKYELVVIASPQEPAVPVNTAKSYLRLAAREAEGIIRTAGHPMPVNELFKIITIDRGNQIIATQPVNFLASGLATSRKLQYLKDFGWWIKGVPWPLTEEQLAKLRAGTLENDLLEGSPERRVGAGRKRSAKSEQLLSALKTILRGRAEPMPFDEIFDRVKEVGIELGGTNKRQTLSVFIRDFPYFVNEGRKRGWRYLPDRDFDEEDEKSGTIGK